MDRDTILKHSKSIRLHRSALPDFIEVLEDFCNKKAHPEHIQGLVQILNTPFIGEQAMDRILEEYEKEFKIIRLISLKTNQILNIW